MMEEIKIYETDCLDALKKSNTVAVPGHLDKTDDPELSKSLEKVKKYRQDIEDLFKQTSNSSPESSKDSHIKFLANYEALFNQIDTETTDQKRRILLGKTVIFKKSYLNQLGILAVFENDFLTDNEVTVIK